MPAKEETRKYLFEDAKLSTEAARIQHNVERDAKEFQTRNITGKNTDDLQAAITDFDNYPTDEEWQGNVTQSTADKDEIAGNLRVQIRPIRNMAELQYKNSGRYRTFGFDGMDKMNDDNLYRLALRVARVGTKLLPELSAQGLTADMLTNLLNEAAKLHDAIEVQAATIEDRDLSTQERIQLGNRLYALVVQMASIGKSLFADKDEARYNDYVLYREHESGTPTPPVV